MEQKNEKKVYNVQEIIDNFGYDDKEKFVFLEEIHKIIDNLDTNVFENEKKQEGWANAINSIRQTVGDMEDYTK